MKNRGVASLNLSWLRETAVFLAQMALEVIEIIERAQRRF